MRTTHGHAVSSALRSGRSGACVTHACARACVRSCKRVCTSTRIHACKRSCMRMCGGNTRTCEQPPAAAGHPLGAKTGDRGRARLSGRSSSSSWARAVRGRRAGRRGAQCTIEGALTDVRAEGCRRTKRGAGGGRRTEASRRKSDRRTGSGHTLISSMRPIRTRRRPAKAGEAKPADGGADGPRPQERSRLRDPEGAEPRR